MKDPFTSTIRSIIEGMSEHIDNNGRPNINLLWMQLKELNAIKWSVKNQGYAISREVYHRILANSIPAKPNFQPLNSKPSTQSDVESEWFLFWMDQLKTAPLPHRKLWEFAWILQNLHAHGLLKKNVCGLGFGCGEEPLPSFFASLGMSITVTDLDPDTVKGMGWAETGQHTKNLNTAFYPEMVSKEQFEKLVNLEFVDMNCIPDKFNDKYDFCWSVCALEHLGSIKNGLDFIENSLSTLKPGGFALHTTEFNYTETSKTIDNHATVLFLKQHFIEISNRLKEKGHTVAPLDFDVGLDPLDTFIDLPPYDFDEFLQLSTGKDIAFRRGHLKLSVDGFPATCFGLKVQKQG